MITGLRSMFFLVVSFVFFLIIVGMLGLSAAMRPGRWSEGYGRQEINSGFRDLF